MAATALAHTYRYAAPSEIVADERGGARLRLATSGGREAHPHFFRGRLRHPVMTAKHLLALSDLVRSRFFVPMTAQRLAEMLDPVVTSGELLRFEVFSACCGAYARADLDPEALEVDRLGKGTTNVDFNLPMRSALARLRDDDRADLSVGWEGVELETDGASVVEKKVKLPLRWIRGFVEVQAHQSRMRPVLETDGAEARRLLRSLPRGATRGRSVWVTRSGRGLRLAATRTRDAVRVAGVERLRALEPLAGLAHRLTVHVDPDTEASLWRLESEVGSFHLALSPEIDRGFSGEGQVLEDLADERGASMLARVRAELDWQPRVDAGGLAERLAADVEAVRGALSRLGSQGLVGYDVASGAYFHRELPFDLAKVERHHPRLGAARELVAAEAVRLVGDDPLEAEVRGSTGTRHRVRVGADGFRCTCRWYAKHRQTRGPCKHVLAAQLVAGREPDADVLA